MTESQPSRRMPRPRPPDLPDFERPPVNEVILSIQFASLPMGNVHAGLLWQRFRDQFPLVTEQPPLAPVFETFGTLPAPGPQIELITTPQTSRFWFESGDHLQLIQVQPDRLIHNWRKKPERDYPRYEPISAQFWDEVAIFAQFTEAEQLGTVRPNQCEVTYTNVIELADGSNPRHQVHRILEVWSGRTSDERLGQPEDAHLQFRYVLQEGERRIGRLYVAATPGLRAADMKPVLQLSLTARGKPIDETIESAFDLLDEGREAVVRGFASITTHEMHKEWGRKDA